MHHVISGEGWGKVTLSLCLSVGRCTPSLFVRECMKFQRLLAAPDPVAATFFALFLLLQADSFRHSLCREVPAELRRLARGGQVNLDMEDHRDEEYVKPKSVFKAFTGEGQKLGR